MKRRSRCRAAGYFLTSVVILAFAGQMALAGVDAPSGSLLDVDTLHNWTVVVGAEKQKRDIAYDGGPTWLLISRSIYGALAWSPANWITLQAGAGGTSVKFGETKGYEDTDSMWGARARVGLAEYTMKRPYMPDARFKMDGSLSYWDHDAVLSNEDAGWTEWRGELLFSAYFPVQDIGFDDPVYPSGVLFRLGPVYSGIESKEAQVGESDWREPAGATGARFHEDQDMGALTGIDFYLAPNVSLGWEMRLYSRQTHEVRLSVRF